MKEPVKGKWGLWYVEGVNSGFTTKEEAIRSLKEKEYAARSQKQERVEKQTFKVFLGVVIALAVSGVAYWWISGKEDRAESSRLAALVKAEKKEKLDALLICQKAIASAAKYGKPDLPPYTSGVWGGEAWSFMWPHGEFVFKNGFGVDVPQSARCDIDPKTREIRYLVISGNEIVR